MRFAIVFAAACGRIGFEPAPPGDGSALDGVTAGEDLIAWYPLDTIGPAGAELIDVTGRHPGACITAGCGVLVSGMRGQAMSFADSADQLRVPSTPELELTGGFTIALWLNARPAGIGSRQHVITKALGTARQNSLALVVEVDATVGMFTESLVDQHEVATVMTIATDRWYHVAIRWDGSANTILVDGVDAANDTFSQVEWDDGPIGLGADTEFVNMVVAPFIGLVDDVRIYKRALQDAEIEAIRTEL